METNDIFGLHALGIARPDDYIVWAEEELSRGADSDSIEILASFALETSPDSQEVFEYFRTCIKERGMEWPRPEDALRQYSARVSDRIVRGEIEPREGVVLLARLWPASDYAEGLYAIWGDLEEDLDLVHTNVGAIFNSGITRDNTDAYIKKVAEQYLTLLDLEFPADFFHLACCTRCDAIERPVRKRVDMPWFPDRIFRLVFRRGPSYRLACVRCGSHDLLMMGDYAGRQRYLDATNRLPEDCR